MGHKIDYESNERGEWYRAGSAASLGIEMAVAICLCTFAAQWVERNLTHWSPWTTLIGLMLGCAAAGKAIARTVREQKAQWAKEEAEAKAAEAASGAPESSGKRGGASPVDPPQEGPRGS